jgi:hypothetical protein
MLGQKPHKKFSKRIVGKKRWADYSQFKVLKTGYMKCEKMVYVRVSP